MIYGFDFCKTTSSPKSGTPLVPPMIFGNFICKCNWLAMVYTLVNANTYTYKSNNDLACIPTNAKFVDNICSQYPNANNNHPILAIASATQPIPTNANKAKSICTNVAMIRLVCTYTNDMS